MREVKKNPVSGAMLMEQLATAPVISTLFSARTTNGTSSVFAVKKGKKTIQAFITGTGSVSGTLTWYGSLVNSASNGVLLATSPLAGTNADVTSEEITTDWPYMFCTLASITGTGAAVTAMVGV
jgi:hypothetical protein